MTTLRAASQAMIDRLSSRRAGRARKVPKSGLPALRIHRLSSGKPLGPFLGGSGMKHKLGMLLAGSALIAGPAAAQNAASLLQAADKAIGASAVNSVVYSGTGWMGAVGQSFSTEGTGSD